MADEMQTEPAPSAELSSKDEERVSVASNWKLVWWRFRKNRLAVASAIVLLMFYVVVLVPDFFSNQDPEATDAALAFIPMQWISIFDATGFHPSVPAIVAVPTTAGTGAEATRNAVIASHEKQFKASIRSELMLPRQPKRLPRDILEQIDGLARIGMGFVGGKPLGTDVLQLGSERRSIGDRSARVGAQRNRAQVAQR